MHAASCRVSIDVISARSHVFIGRLPARDNTAAKGPSWKCSHHFTEPSCPPAGGQEGPMAQKAGHCDLQAQCCKRRDKSYLLMLISKYMFLSMNIIKLEC